ncbi:MAG: GHMP kinase [Planctomycetia bacterium]|nr:GHMP kinase [Planctomycetia bacterium]
MILKHKAFARAGLVGNPSDGYHGKTISIIIRNFWAEAVLYEWDTLEILPGKENQNRFSTVHDLVKDVKLHGYYGGVRLVKATIKKFVEYCYRHQLPLHDRNFSIRFESNIPRQVGLAGSSAIITATLRCLMDFYDIDIPMEVQPSLILSVENDELGITAGLQDRVIQVYEGLVYMDFAKEKMREMKGFSHGVYERLDTSLLPPLYLAFKADVSEPTEVFHNDIRSRYRQGDAAVVQAMQTFADLAAQGKDALQHGDRDKLHWCMNRNFDTRRSIYQLPAGQIEMIDVARSSGASAKFAGSGGAILGMYQDESQFEQLQDALRKIQCVVIKPQW